MKKKANKKKNISIPKRRKQASNLERPEEMIRVLENRLELHRFVVQTLDQYDFHWGSSDQELSFFQSFFSLLYELILKRFFHPNYDSFL